MSRATPWTVSQLPGEPHATSRSFQIEAGYLPARPPVAPNQRPKDEAHLYFMLHRAMYTPRRRKLIVWLNGGPGCSSFDGAFLEVGALRVKPSDALVEAQAGQAWNEYADVLYVDQPVGTGFSYVENAAYAETLDQVAEEFVFFLRGFAQAYPEYTQGVDVYLAGESYAGQYIPYMADAMLRASNLSLHLEGIAIGNGFIDPASQYGTEVDTLLQAGVWKKNGPEHEHIKPILRACQDALQKDSVPRAEYPVCDGIVGDIIKSSVRTLNGVSRCMNMYDMRLTDTSPACGMNWPAELPDLYTFLRKKDVRSALHIDANHKPEAWVECNAQVGDVIHAHAANSNASVTLLPSLLNRGVPVLLFAGDQDLICPALGQQRLVERLHWLGSDGPGDAKPEVWSINQQPVGTWLHARNLTLATLTNASHMAAYDAPYAAHDMMLRFMDVQVDWVDGAQVHMESKIGSTSRILVAENSTATTSTPSPLKSTSTPLPTTRPGSSSSLPQVDTSDWSGDLFVVVVLALAVWLCFYVRRRARRPAGAQYHAIGEHIVLQPTHASQHRAAAAGSMSPDMERGAFTLGGDDDDDDDNDNSPTKRFRD